MKTASFHLGFISDLPHFSISFGQFSISFSTMNGTIDINWLITGGRVKPNKSRSFFERAIRSKSRSNGAVCRSEVVRESRTAWFVSCHFIDHCLNCLHCFASSDMIMNGYDAVFRAD